MRKYSVPVVVLALGLTACTEAPREATRGDALLGIAAPATTRAVARDVPAPDVFQVSETGLWDGRPSLGGIWVAHPAAVDPERVLIRNTATGAEVIGALFRRERENPGPRFQISSEAAAALGILAGQPATVEVIALRVEEAPAAPAAPAPAAPVAQTTDAAAPVETAAAPDAPAVEEAPAPRRTLRDLFRRRDAAPESPEAPVEAAALPSAPAVAAPPVPAGGPVETVAITPLEAEPEAPRRTLFDLFRRREAAPEAPAISQTALAPVAPVVAPAVAPVVAPVAAAAPVVAQTAAAAPAVIGAPLVAVAFLSEGGEAAPPRPARFDEPGLIAPEAAAEASGWSLRDLFRRREAAPEAPAEATLIPVPAVATAPVPAATPVAATAVPAIDRPFVQAAVFSVEANAERARARMQSAGLPAELRQGRSGERTVWRLIVGPATDPASQSELVRQTRAMGFADAYAVRG